MRTHFGDRVDGAQVGIKGKLCILHGIATICGVVPESYEGMTTEKALVSCEECTAKLGVARG